MVCAWGEWIRVAYVVGAQTDSAGGIGRTSKDSDDWVVDDLSGLEMRKEKFVMRLKKDRNLIREEECRWFVAWSVGSGGRGFLR